MVQNEPWEMDLYVVDDAPKAKLAYQNLKKIMRHVHKTCKIRMVDLEKNPRAAVENGIAATPTTIRRHPKPQVTLIGTLADEDRVIAKLGLKD